MKMTSFRSFTFVSLFLLLGFHSSAQLTKIDTAAIRADLSLMDKDSLLKELKGMLDSSGNQKSFFSATVSVSNRLFSSTNNAFNAQQTSSGAAILPSVSYYHKSGLGMTSTAYVRPGTSAAGLYQMAFTPSYDFIGSKSMAGISYTRYLKTDPTNSFATPYDNEVYGYFQMRKTWIRPSLTLGWAEGSYKDVSTIPVSVRGNTIWVTDTSRITINDFSVIAGISHSFNFSDVLANGDMLTVLPQLSLIGGIQQYNSTPLSRNMGYGPRSKLEDLERVRERYNFRSSSTTSNFMLQTAAASLNLSWYKGAFSFSGGYFMGYYFQSATSSQWAHIFNLSVGITF
ncbi:MAG: hypothetical protein RL282_294 [Bacteroidota bacterium]